jgi:PAS domain S-box-containing protein
MLYDIVAMVTAGVSLTIGSISFVVGLGTKDKTDLVFGLMGLSLFVFFLLPPPGFIIRDHAPYPPEILIKRVFIYGYYAMIPWFIFLYVGFKSNKVPLLISTYIVICYVIMFNEDVDRAKPIWSLYSVGAFGAILAYGIVASVKQYKTDKAKAPWLSFTFVVYGVLFLLTAFNQLGGNFIADALAIELFFPMHFHALLLMLIMGLRVISNVIDKFKLERMIVTRDRRWSSLMESAPMVVLELDRSGNVMYLNKFGASLLGYENSTSVLHLNWFENFLPSADAPEMRALFEKMLQENHAEPYLKSTIRTREGNYVHMSWVNFLNRDDDGNIIGITRVGRDLTREDSANRLIGELKGQLEKEAIDFSSFSKTDFTLIGTSKAISYAVLKANQVASTQAPVLIEGETGVGKDLLAELIYKNSSRNGSPFVKVNCGALPKDLIEDELFGHEKGAFTSAIQARKGRFELADGGTMFLDEVGELPLEMQPKLLRVLQNGEFERIGGQKTLKVDVRIIAATNRDLSVEVQHGRFRSDLYYRLNVFPITIPALRHRKDDLPLLINHFIAQECKKYGKEMRDISKSDLQKLIDYPWPGNVRELRNVIERAVISSTGSTLKLDWFLSLKIQEESDAHTLEEIERQHILKVMEECKWKINGLHGAAEVLNMHPNTLRSKMKKLGIFRPGAPAGASANYFQ